MRRPLRGPAVGLRFFLGALLLGGLPVGGEDPTGPPAQGARDPAVEGWLGAEVWRSAAARGIAVRSVEEGGPAQQGGLRKGDAILALQGHPAQDPYAFTAAVRRLAPGAALLLEVRREERLLSLEVRLGRRPLRPVFQAAAARGRQWLAGQQLPSGAWATGRRSAGAAPATPCSALTALSLLALASGPAAERTLHAAPLQAGISFLLARQGPAGLVLSPQEPVQLQTYATALAIRALRALDAERSAGATARMRDGLERSQLVEAHGFAEAEPLYGSWNYYDQLQSHSLRGDTSVLVFALEGLRAGALDGRSPAWNKALVFLRRCQNLADDPGLAVEADDGGFFSEPQLSKAGETPDRSGRHMRLRSYGSATCDGLRSLLLAGLSKEDPRVQAALGWLRRNYTLRENPGFAANVPVAWANGMFFYYVAALAAALDLYGVETVTTPDGELHFWPREVGDWLSGLQKEDGSWANACGLMGEDDPVAATALALLALESALKRLD
ncbi:MAG: PDZ domain-containing protein [Planctomycetes bacterium]|nr:PDZ domain-containing protein [Planctomycetota bacterium]